MIALNTISTNLERIGDLCENVVKQMSFFNDYNHIKLYDYNAYFKIIFQALDEVSFAMVNSNIESALSICRAEVELDECCARDLKLIMTRLTENERDSQDLITALFIVRYLERIGDSLLNIGEAIISSTVGTKLKVTQYLSLRDTFEAENFEFHKLGGETRSGCNIERVRSGNGDDINIEVVFKEGKAKKIKEEMLKLQTWHDIFPGIAPRVLEHRLLGDNALILMEFILGHNYQEILIGSDVILLSQANKELINTVNHIWKKTHQSCRVNAGFISQLINRFPDILAVHPRLALDRRKTVGSLVKPSLQYLLDTAYELEKTLYCPFSVMIHGDFNNDNIIYNESSGSIHLIDLHRSTNSDYVQDVSVFLVSNFRLPVFENALRERLNYANIVFYRFAQAYARENNDSMFEQRLTLGLARSFITSARFTLNDSFSQELFYRAIYLLDRLCKLSETKSTDYQVGEDVLCY
jgi:hypothetical protein